jgi:hypothetical protein
MKHLLLATLFFSPSSKTCVVTVTLPPDFPARIQHVVNQIGAGPVTTEEFVRYATEAELTGMEGTLHVGVKR